MEFFPCRSCHAVSETKRWVLRYGILLLLICLSIPTLSFSQSAEEFSEELLLRPLPDGRVVAHFHFTHQLPPSSSYGSHHRLFPKAIYQLVQKFRIREMELSFTQGRWNYNMWGGVDPLTRLHAKPSGVELWAVFAVPEDQLDATWGNLTHALSGLFCASLNFLDSPAMVANPVRAFIADHGNEEVEPLLHSNVNSVSVSKRRRKVIRDKHELMRRVRYGALPREAVCTENLTPWLKLLPCRDKAGLSMLLDRPVIYKSWYHSLRLYVRSYEFEEPKNGEQKGTLLQQTLSLVVQPSDGPRTPPRVQPSWSLHSYFGRHLSGKCLLAKHSVVYMEFEGALMEKLEHSGMDMAWKKRRDICMPTGDSDGLHASEPSGCSKGTSEYQQSLLLSEFQENSIFRVQGVPSNFSLELVDYRKPTSGLLLEFSVPEHVEDGSFHLGLTWKVPFTWRPVQGPFRATRFLVGSGNARGAIAIVLKSNQLQAGGSMDLLGPVSRTGGFVASEVMTVTIFQVVPWYIRLYFHTSKVAVDGRPVAFWEVVRWMQVVPSEDRTSPGVMEIELLVPSNASEVTLITEFDKGFLRIDEHPPDANRGFDLPSALLSFPDQPSQARYRQLAPNVDTKASQESALLRELLRKKAVQVYTEVLLVPLATPDFSMPYNVITLTCTVLALYFGSLLNVLRRRMGEEERLANNPEGPSQSMLERLITRLLGRNRGASAATISKFVKFSLVAGLAVAMNHYLSNN